MAFRNRGGVPREGLPRGESAAGRHASTAVSSLVCQISAFRAPPGAKHDHGITPFSSMGRPHYAGKARLMPSANTLTLAWRERMKSQVLGKTRSALMLLMFVMAQAHFSAHAQTCPPPPSPSAQHPTLLAGYAKRPPWQVAGVDFAVGVPSTATLTDWRSLSGPGITVNTTAVPPYVRVDSRTNVVIACVDFSLYGGAYLFLSILQIPRSSSANLGEQI